MTIFYFGWDRYIVSLSFFISARSAVRYICTPPQPLDPPMVRDQQPWKAAAATATPLAAAG